MFFSGNAAVGCFKTQHVCSLSSVMRELYIHTSAGHNFAQYDASLTSLSSAVLCHRRIHKETPVSLATSAPS